MDLSISRVNMYLRCGLQFYYRYIKNLTMPPSASMTQGKCVHSTFEHNYKQKITSKTDLPLEEVLDFYSDSLNKEKSSTDWKEEDFDRIKDTGISAITVYHNKFAPLIQPKEVEKWFELEFDKEKFKHKIRGVIDIIDDEDSVRDHKVVKRSCVSRYDNCIQLPVYSFTKAPKGNEIVSCKIDMLITKKDPEVVTLDYKFGKNDRIRAMYYVSTVANAIEKGVFMPAKPDDWTCNPKWCGYYHMCKKAMIL